MIAREIIMVHWRLMSFMFLMLIFLHGYVESTRHSSGLLFYNGIRNVQLTQNADFNTTYSGIVNDSSSAVYEFRYNISSTKENPVRIYSTSNESHVDFPTMFVIRQERSVISWQIPLVLQYSNEYIDVGRTLCPMQNDTHTLQPFQKIYVEVSTQSKTNVYYTLIASRLNNFLLEVNKDYPVISSPSNPVYYKYKFTGDIESVIITAKSKDHKCSILSIQDIKCPVFDLPADVVYQGKYQTMTTRGAITVTKDEFSSGSFYVVIVVKPNDNDCSNGINQVQPIGFYNIRQKLVTIHIKQTIPSSEYYRAIIAAVGLFIAFYIVALLIGIFYHGCKDRWGIIDIPTFETSMSEDESSQHIVQRSNRGHDYGSIPGIVDNVADRAQSVHVTSDNDNRSIDSLNSIDSEEYDVLKDADHDKDVLRTKTALFVSDLSRKSEKRADKNYKLYCNNLFTIAIFYVLPVVQLVITYQQVLNFTGDQDICYYNFECAHPLGKVSSFNNIFSNIGYVMLGILFLLLVYRRSWLHRIAVEKNQGRHKKYGIPQHFGLFYAMGFALCMEGIMSACYHVCPTVSNFQFDTSFMYIMACLCILKIYQNRHPDISAKPQSAYMIMAFVIFIAVIGVVYGTNIFWLLFALVYMTSSLLLSIHIYYMGRWKIDRYVFKKMLFLMISDWCKCRKPMYLNRFILLLLGNVVNWSIAIFGVVGEKKFDFASFLLAIFIGNLLLYSTFYILSKKLSGEKVPTLTWVIILLAMVTWGFSLYFFLQHLTSWQYTPAVSREGNRECVVLNFYDTHDIWHFLSAISLFFSFLVLLTLDDEIIMMKRNEIPVF